MTPWYGLWHPGAKCVRKKKTGLTDGGVATGVKKTQSDRGDVANGVTKFHIASGRLKKIVLQLLSNSLQDFLKLFSNFYQNFLEIIPKIKKKLLFLKMFVTFKSKISRNFLSILSTKIYPIFFNFQQKVFKFLSPSSSQKICKIYLKVSTSYLKLFQNLTEISANFFYYFLKILPKILTPIPDIISN